MCMRVCLSLSDTLLAVASSAGWLAVYAPMRPGERAWEKMYSGVVTGRPLVAFSPDGSHMLLASGEIHNTTQQVKHDAPDTSAICTR